MRIAATIVLYALTVFSMTWSAADLAASSEPAVPASLEAYQLLTNPGMEQAFVPYGNDFRGVACEVATAWIRFGDVAPRPCWMDTRDFARYVMNTSWVERIEGETSQAIISTEPYVAGIYQRVTDLTPGLPYGFHAAMLTIYQSSANPPEDNKMIKQVGMDPTGGVNPNAPTVVWSEPEDLDKKWDIQRRTAVVAQSSAVTVFIRVTSPYASGDPSYINQSFLDSAILAQTATVSAVAPEISPTPTFTVRWENAQASPGETIEYYDVQWMDEANGQWNSWLLETKQTQATFTGLWGHTYRFRARAWQEYPNGAYLFSPYAPAAGAPTAVADARLIGQVRGNGPFAWGGAIVSIVGTSYSAVSQLDGSYEMFVDLMEVPQTVSVSGLPWLSPEPVYGVTFGEGETVTLDWALRPPDDAVQNGGFEGGLGDWAVVPVVEAALGVTAPVHTGVGAVMLGVEGEPSQDAGYASGVEQTVSLDHSWNPNVSFWYLPEAADSDDRFEVTLTVGGDSLSFPPSLAADGWQHQWYSLGIGEDYFTGAVTIRFELWNDGDEFPAMVWLDEVALGRTPGGPFRAYLPLVSR